MIIYLDTEFTDLVGIVSDIKLISAGFVAESGQELYFELPDNFEEGECNSFVLEAVLPHLDSQKHGMTNATAAAALKAWFEGFQGEVQLGSDAPGYDCALVVELLRDNDCWPANLNGKPAKIDAGRVDPEIENYFQHQPMAVRHHALWDARALAAACQALEAKPRHKIEDQMKEMPDGLPRVEGWDEMPDVGKEKL